MTFSFKLFWHLLWRDPLGLHLYKGAPSPFISHTLHLEISLSSSFLSSLTQVLPSTLAQVLPSTPLSLKCSLALSTSFKCFHTKHIGGTSLFELYCILQRECTRGKIWLLNPRGTASVSYDTKVTNRSRANLL